MPFTVDGQPMAGNAMLSPVLSGQPSMHAMPQNSDYMQQYSQYVQQYYREYYRQWLHQHNRQHLSSLSSHTTAPQPQLRQPLKYGNQGCHARAVFSQHNNDVLVVDNTSVGVRTVRLYSLSDLFVDYLFPNQLFDMLLRSDDSDDNQLPFVCRESALQWIRCKQQLTTTTTDFELKLILRVIQMLLKQNSRITGLDLSGNLSLLSTIDNRFPLQSFSSIWSIWTNWTQTSSILATTSKTMLSTLSARSSFAARSQWRSTARSPPDWWTMRSLSAIWCQRWTTGTSGDDSRRPKSWWLKQFESFATLCDRTTRVLTLTIVNYY